MIRSQLPTPTCYDFNGDPSHSGLFSRIVRGEEQHWRVWEDNQHVAFLSPFPNTPGFTILVPRRPLSSDIFCLDKNDYIDLILAARKLAQLLEEGMGASGVALIFEGLEINYAHAKLIPIVTKPGEIPPTVPTNFCPIYPGYVTSVDGPPANADALKELHTKIAKTTPPHTWENPQSHSILAIKSQWYRNLFQIQNTLFHTTVDYFSKNCKYSYALTPITTDTISSPMGLGSDSEPVFVNMLGQDVYLADSMQFVLEYFLRFQEGLPGTYYVSPSFRGEEPDSTHLNQFYHVECELLGDMNAAISIAESYVVHLTQAMLKYHSKMILSAAGTLSHAQDLMKRMEKPLPRVTLEQAIPMMPSSDCIEWVKEGQPQCGRKLTRKGEAALIEQYGGAVWLTEMDHLSVPFYQAYVEGSCETKAKAADLLLGLGETVGLGERHSTPEMVQEALRHHAVLEESYKWYIDMRKVVPLSSSGWGMGTERYLCWLLQHSDVRDMQIIPRMKAKKYMP
ncbi:asparagine--tRNA ligase-like [Silurus meridionalis]|nr:asparagine--tRNA ligase-like [Silurus meridionalis]